MKNIFKLIKYFVCLTGTIIFFSCNSALDKTPLTEYSDSNFWQEPAQASAALIGAYNRLQSTLNTEFMYYGEGRADIDSLLTSNDVASIGVIRNTLSPNVNFADWGNFYQVIKQANLIIANIKVMKEKGIYNVSNNAEYNRVLGQAHGLRALCYFYMTRIWGDVPLLTEPITDTENINSLKTPRTPIAEVYKLVISDLYTARQLLPASYTGNFTRITLTRGAIEAILTDYYMWTNNVDSALATSQRVIGNSQYRLADLYTPGRELFAQGRPANAIDSTEYGKMFIEGFSNESIFEIDYSYLEATSSGISGLYGGGVGVATFVAHPRLLAKFAQFENDPRTLANIRLTVQVFKYFPKGNYSRVTENDKNVILYRLSDIILLRAEALNKKGDRQGAWDLLKRIRERAFGPVRTLPPPASSPNDPVNGPTSDTEKNKFLTATTEDAETILLDERVKELCFEGKRWYDLVRTGRAIKVMGPINNLLTPGNILWPIHINVLRQNPQIQQNEYYK